MNDAISQCHKLLVASGIVAGSQSERCTHGMIRELMEAQAVATLPKLYVDFMTLMGRSRSFLVGSDIMYPEVKGNKEGLTELLMEEWPEHNLDTSSVFVFYGHQGYQYSFFFVDSASDDPCVHYYLFNEKAFKVASESFSKWLTEAVDYTLKGYL
ncbi:hypothetical protein DAERI_050165 [Deinococcus aerius]|uniref:Knr4/Smi1-like domain-containing protein n=1 Tax=Deinococcus aerius TaxID=200253 RepID=A0A2I9D4S8_9DEIO|nr:hypothetical protein [Deinococcus aerius]GBF05656.1 hypothetical protein DAERI_050165 [Deinococcus aerius]